MSAHHIRIINWKKKSLTIIDLFIFCSGSGWEIAEEASSFRGGGGKCDRWRNRCQEAEESRTIRSCHSCCFKSSRWRGQAQESRTFRTRRLVVSLSIQNLIILLNLKPDWRWLQQYKTLPQSVILFELKKRNPITHSFVSILLMSNSKLFKSASTNSAGNGRCRRLDFEWRNRIMPTPISATARNNPISCSIINTIQ